MWSMLVLTALANPKKDLAAALKARDARDTETALKLFDGALRGGLKPKFELEARLARIGVITSHPDPEQQLELLPVVHEDLTALGLLQPDGVWAYKLRDEIPLVVDLTNQAIDQAEAGNPRHCALVVPHHHRTTPIAVLGRAMACAIAIDDVSAARGIARDLVAASEAQDNTDPTFMRQVVSSAFLTVEEAPSAMLKRLDMAEKELDDIERRIDANQEMLGDAYSQHVRAVEDVRFDAMATRLSVLERVPDSAEERKTLLQKLLKRDPGNYNAHIMLAQLQLEMGDEEAGLASLGRAAALEPGKPTAPYAEGVYWVNQTVPLQEKLQGMNPRDAETKALEAELEAQFGKARDALMRAYEADPSQADAASALQTVCGALKDRACMKKLESAK